MEDVANVSFSYDNLVTQVANVIKSTTEAVTSTIRERVKAWTAADMARNENETELLGKLRTKNTTAIMLAVVIIIFVVGMFFVKYKK